MQMNEEKKESAVRAPSEEWNFDWNNRDNTLSFISNLCKRIDKKRNAAKARLFKSILRQSRDLVLEKAQSITDGASTYTSHHIEEYSESPLLPSHSERFVEAGDTIGRYDHKVRLLQAKAKKWQRHQVNKPIYLEGVTKERPTAKSTVFLNSNYAAEDQKNLTFAPYFGDDDDNDDALGELFDTSKREELLDSGPEHVEEQRNEFIDEVLEIAMKALEERIDSLPSTRFRADLINVERIMFRVQDHIAYVKGYDHVHIRQRYTLKCEPRVMKMMYEEQRPTNALEITVPDTSVGPLVKNSEIVTDEYVEYGDLMDSYRHLFCRQCFVYDCNRHGVLGRSNDTIPLETTLAVRKEKEGGWKDDAASTPPSETQPLPGAPHVISNADTHNQSEILVHVEEAGTSSTYPRELTTLQRVVCQHAYQICNGDVDQIALLLKANPGALKDFAKETNIKAEDHTQLYCQFIGTSDRKPKKKKRKYDGCMNNFDQAWLKRVETAEIHPAYEACDHIEPCSEETCSCVKNAFFCTKYCIWGSESKYFFPGCRCKRGECRQKSCPCFAAGKECDPDLCTDCGACTDTQNRPAVKQRCRNDNIGMRRHCQLLVAKSHVKEAGWGVYNKAALKKGDFIHEYLGEVISQEEADRRGCIYDKVNRSFLFNLTSDTVVDASRKGNKTR
jgi:hypothetical protein